MCTYVETPDLGILIDPGASLGQRFGLLPHPQEYHALQDARRRIAEYSETSSVVTISHYHNDHATPYFTDYLWNLSDSEVALQLYKGKEMLVKDYRSMINSSQRRRGWMLKERFHNEARSFQQADGHTFTFGKTQLNFSEPVPHGEPDTPLGWVLMLNVTYGEEVFVHASDVQGPMVTETAETLLKWKPSLTYIGGPPTYLSNYRVKGDAISKAFENLTRIVENVPTVIVDHHLLREGVLNKDFERISALSKDIGHRFLTAAEFLGLENSFLESKRKDLYEKSHPSTEFMAWTRLSEDRRMRTVPPT